MSANKKPATPAEAEDLAVLALQQYLTACRISEAAMTDQSIVADYLMKLCSVAGSVMAQAVGADDAFQRLHGTAVFIAQTMPAEPAQLVKVQ